MLIDANIDLELKTPPNEWTALMMAAFSGHDNCTKLLIDAGADVHGRSKDSRTVRPPSTPTPTPREADTPPRGRARSYSSPVGSYSSQVGS